MEKDQFHKLFYDKLTKYEIIELLNRYNVNKKNSTGPNSILIDSCVRESYQLGGQVTELCHILVPLDEFDNVQIEEFHQIIRELTMGIYCFGEIPQIALIRNVDMSSTCDISPAYRRTRVAEILTEVDYMIKSLWCGYWFPKDKRIKFTDVWRKKLDVDENGQIQTKRDIYSEFEAGGMVDIHKDLSSNDNFVAFEASPVDDMKVFNKYKDSYLLKLFFRVSEIEKYNNIFKFESEWDIEGIINSEVNPLDIHTITTYLQKYKRIVKDNICLNPQINYYIYLIKFIGFASNLLIRLKRNNTIPDMHLLQSLIPGSIQDEREVPPLISKEGENHDNDDVERCHLEGGIGFEIDCENIDSNSALLKSLDIEKNTNMTVIEVKDKKYYVVPIPTEDFKDHILKLPFWFEDFIDNAQKKFWANSKQSESQINEYFKKHYGSKGANIRKFSRKGLRSACRRGSTSIVNTLIADISKSFINTKDKNGYSLIHYSILHDQSLVFLGILYSGGDINNSCGFNSKRNYMAVHLAAKMGSLAVFQIMASSRPHLINCADNEGWLPIHYASAYNHPPLMRVIKQRCPSQLGGAKNLLLQSPIHLAAMYGAIDSLKYLLRCKVDYLNCDKNGARITRLATLSLHSPILQLLIEQNLQGLNVWTELGEMVLDVQTRTQSLKCIEVLASKIKNAAESIYETSCLINLKKLIQPENGREEQEDVLISSIFDKISRKIAICVEFSHSIFINYFSSLLKFESTDILLNTTQVLANILELGDKQSIDLESLMPPLLHLLDNKSENVLINTFRVIGLISADNNDIQLKFLNSGINYRYLNFLEIGSNPLRVAVCDSVFLLCLVNPIVQREFVSPQFIKIMKKLININNVSLKTAASRAIRATALRNTPVQKIYIENGFLEDICNLFQFLSLVIKEEAAASLSALRGNVVLQQKMVAEALGISRITELLLSVEKLKIFGCKNIIALTTECFYWQKKTCESEALKVLTMLINSNLSLDVRKIIIQTLGVLCLGLAHRTLKSVQNKITTDTNLQCFVNCFFQSEDKDLKLKSAYTISCLYLNKNKSDIILARDKKQTIYKELFSLFKQASEDEKLQIGSTFVNFCFGSYEEKYSLFCNGTLRNSTFHQLMNSPSLKIQSEAAFQGIILSCIMFDEDRVMFIAKCISVLIKNLSSSDTNCVIITARRISSLLNSDVGIGNSLITAGIVEISIELLKNPNCDVVEAIATMIGYLTFNNIAFRMLLTAVRSIPKIYFDLMRNINKDAVINPTFVETFQDNLMAGLPIYRLPTNSVYPTKRIEWRRVKTAIETQQRRIRYA